MKVLLDFLNKTSLVLQIAVGLVVGIILALVAPSVAEGLTLAGSLFVGALKAIAPMLVFVLVMASIANHQHGTPTNMRRILLLYVLGTFGAALTAVLASEIWKLTLSLKPVTETLSPPQNVVQVMKNLVMNMVDNPIKAMSNGNYIGILTWAVILGVGLRHANDTTKKLVSDAADAVSHAVRFVIRFAPLGVMGLVADSILTSGLAALMEYGQLLLLLIGCMLFVALLINPLIVWSQTRRNPFPLVFTCLRESGITAFFTRSSAANIPVNLALAERLGLNRNTYSVSIPLGATINMAGAAVTITVLTLAAVHTLQIPVDFGTALLLSVLASVAACGASGVAGGSLLLIPMACSLFGIPDAIAIQVVGVGFVIGVLQDAFETALNSSTDVLFTAAADPVMQQRG